jgi:hypothetical protein
MSRDLIRNRFRSDDDGTDLVVHNRRCRKLKDQQNSQQWSFLLTPNDAGGATAMLAFRF